MISLLIAIISILFFFIFTINYLQERLDYLRETSKILQEVDILWLKINRGSLKTEEEIRSSLNELVKYHDKFKLRIKYYKEHYQ